MVISQHTMRSCCQTTVKLQVFDQQMVLTAKGAEAYFAHAHLCGFRVML